MVRIIAMFLVVMTLGGCVNQKPYGRNEDNYPALESLVSWQLRGKIGIRSPKGNVNLGFLWAQSQENYDISLTGALGVQVAHLNGDASEMMLALPNGINYDNAGIDRIVEMLPLYLLRYWVRGIPNPMFDHESNPDGFFQQGWQVQLQQAGTMGPRKILVHREDIMLRLVALEWIY